MKYEQICVLAQKLVNDYQINILCLEIVLIFHISLYILIIYNYFRLLLCGKCGPRACADEDLQIIMSPLLFSGVVVHFVVYPTVLCISIQWT